MDAWWIVVAIVAASVTGGVLWWYLRKNLPPEVGEMLAEAVARVQAELRDVVSEAEVRAFAEMLWDNNVGNVQGLAPYYDKEKFIALVVRTVMGAIAEQSMVALAIGWSSGSGQVEA